MEIIFVLIGGLTAYFNHRNSKTDGPVVPEIERQEAKVENYMPKPLGPNPKRLQRIAHWLGIEEG